MIRYLIDGRALQDGSAVRGIGTYVRGLLSGLAEIGASDGVGLLLARGPVPAAAAGVPVHRRRLPRTNRHLRPLLDPFQVRVALSMDPPSLFHAVEFAQPILAPVPVVVTVHDLIPFVIRDDRYRWMRRERALAVRQLRFADRVIAVSAATARDVERVAGVDHQRISVVHEGVDHHEPTAAGALAATRARLGLPDHFLLAVGTFEPRKRIHLLVKVARLLRDRHDVGLVLAGSQGSFAPEVAAAVEQAGLSEQTRILGHVSTAELAALYELGDCLVFTSAYEGFGLPPLEAMAAGMPVVAFDNSSLREVIGEAGVLVPDADAAQMAAAVGRILEDPQRRRALAVAGRNRSREFTWARTARATLDVYARALGRR